MKKTMLLALLGTVAMASGTFEVMGSTETKIKNDQKVSEAVKGTKGKATAKVDVVFGETGLSAGAKLAEEIKHDAKLQFKLKPFEAYVKYAMPEYDGFNASVKGSVVVEQDKFDVYEFTKKFKLLVDGSYKLGDATLYGSSEHEFKGYEASKINNTITLGVKGKNGIVSGKAEAKLKHSYEKFKTAKVSGDVKVVAAKDLNVLADAYLMFTLPGEEATLELPALKLLTNGLFEKMKVEVADNKFAINDGAKLGIEYTGLKDKKVDKIYANISYDHMNYEELHGLKALAKFGVETTPYENLKLNAETSFGYYLVIPTTDTKIEFGHHNFNAKLAYDYKAVEKLTITPSFKFESDVMFNDLDHHYIITLTPALATKYMATENLTLSGSVETRFDFRGGRVGDQDRYDVYEGVNVKTNIGVKYTW